MSRYVIEIVYVSAALILVPVAAGQSEFGSPRFMQGPMVGAVFPGEVRIWLRASHPFECSVRFSEDPAMGETRESSRVGATKANDYCVVVRMTGLEPDTTYYYVPYINGSPGSYTGRQAPFRVKTAPASPARFRLAFGSCARYPEDRLQPIWGVTKDLAPDLFFWVGDNIYGDATDPDILAEEYRRQRDFAGIPRFLSGTPQLATWDDHDFGLNNHDRRNPIKADALKVFKQYWANPEYGTRETPGVFFAYSYGGVDFFFLDGRYYRDPNEAPDTPDKTHLGNAQLEWLKSGLRESRAPFKVLVSGSGFNNGKGPGGDSWASYLHERDALFDFIRDEEITGVLLMSGDTHVGELNCMPWSEKGAYDLYEIVSSPLAQSTGGDNYMRAPELRIQAPVIDAPNVGILDFDMTADPPTVRVTLFDQYGSRKWNWTKIAADELRNGVNSWPDKISEAGRRALEFSRGGQERLREN